MELVAGDKINFSHIDAAGLTLRLTGFIVGERTHLLDVGAKQQVPHWWVDIGGMRILIAESAILSKVTPEPPQ